MTLLKSCLTFGFIVLLGYGSAFGQIATAEINTADLHNAVAVELDNAEGLLEPHVRMRVVLSDRAVPADALLGVAFPPVRDMARRGALRGLMIEFDPSFKTSAQITVLEKPADPAAFLSSISLSNSAGLWPRLEVDAKHVAGRFVSPDQGFDLVFDTPVFTDPVVSNVTGAAVRSSPLVAMLRAHVQALSKGDLAAVNALVSRDKQLPDAKALPPAGNPQFKAYLAGYAKALDKASRVVVRGRTAVVLLPDGEFAQFVREGGEWKIAD